MEISTKQWEQIGAFCFGCGKRFNRVSIGCGRCKCGRMIASVNDKTLKEEFNNLSEEMQNKIIKKIEGMAQ